MFQPWPRVACSFLAASLPLVASAQAAPTGGLSGNLLGMAPFVLMFAVVYVLMMRPAQQQRAKQEAMLAALKKDDEVVTQSGLIGRIAALNDDVVTLELAQSVRVRMLRERIVGPYAASKTGSSAKAAALQADKAR